MIFGMFDKVALQGQMSYNSRCDTSLTYVGAPKYERGNMD